MLLLSVSKIWHMRYIAKHFLIGCYKKLLSIFLYWFLNGSYSIQLRLINLFSQSWLLIYCPNLEHFSVILGENERELAKQKQYHPKTRPEVKFAEYVRIDNCVLC